MQKQETRIDSRVNLAFHNASFSHSMMLMWSMFINLDLVLAGTDALNLLFSDSYLAYSFVTHLLVVSGTAGIKAVPCDRKAKGNPKRKSGPKSKKKPYSIQISRIESVRTKEDETA